MSNLPRVDEVISSCNFGYVSVDFVEFARKLQGELDACRFELRTIHSICLDAANCPPVTPEDKVTVRYVKDLAHLVNSQTQQLACYREAERGLPQKPVYNKDDGMWWFSNVGSLDPLTAWYGYSNKLRTFAIAAVAQVEQMANVLETIAAFRRATEMFARSLRSAQEVSSTRRRESHERHAKN